MGTLNSDLAWKAFGKQSPYYGVLSHEKYRNGNLTTDNFANFFKSGRRYVEAVFNDIHRYIDKDFSPQTTLDFGYGTGRLLIPFSRRTQEILGMDISEQMIHEAKKNCEEEGIRTRDSVFRIMI